MKWICCQVGAREHYAVPRALIQGGAEVSLYTDSYAGPFVRRAASVFPNRFLRSAAARFDEGLRSAPVKSWNVRSLVWELGLRRAANRFDGFVEVGRAFGRTAGREIAKRSNPGTIVFSYDTAALEIFEACRPRGAVCVLDQMDPHRVEFDLVREEEERWPGWSLEPLNIPLAYLDRRESEWRLADKIVVNSNWSKTALISQGVPQGKIVVVPLAFEANAATPRRKSDDGQLPNAASPLRVLFLGQVNLRKGIQYLAEAAKLLGDEPVKFDIVGPLSISETAVKSCPPNMQFHGRSSRDQAREFYKNADVFVLPTISDGFALTQIEAMACGLPVVTTPNCGDVVTDGVDGQIVAARDASALENAIRRYMRDENLIEAQGTAALAKAGQFSLARLGNDLSEISRSVQVSF